MADESRDNAPFQLDDHTAGEWKRQLQELTDVVAVSGHEDALIDHVADAAADHADAAGVDTLGNVTARIECAGTGAGLQDDRPQSRRPRVLVFAHLDELGFVVRKIEEDGFLRLERCGGVPEKSMAGQRMVIETAEGRRLDGVIGTKSHHVTPSEEKHQVVPVRDAYADFGFASAAAAREAGVRVGTMVGYARQFFSRGPRVYANALDNRAAVLVLLQLMERLSRAAAAPQADCDVYVVFSVQEEFNLRGVLPAVRQIEPDVAVTLDISIAADTPDLAALSDVRLGGGPSVATYTFHGRGTLGGLIPNPALVDHVEGVAAQSGIPLQRAVFMGGLTDASFSQLENDGIPFVDLGFPARYTHAPVEAVDLRDLVRLTDLLQELVPSLAAAGPFGRQREL